VNAVSYYHNTVMINFRQFSV